MGGTPPAALDAPRAEALLGDVQAGRTELLGALEGTPLLVVDVGPDGTPGLPLVPWLPCVTVGLLRSRPAGPAPGALDVALTTVTADALPAGWVAVDDLDRALDELATQVAASPQAAVVLCQILRSGITTHGDVVRALFDESLAYSCLQSGPVFCEWLARRGAPRRTSDADEPDAVLVERHDGEMVLTLNRPHARNAVDVRMRDELIAALAVASADSSIRSIHLRGAGPAFSSGGDLYEFGTTPDPVVGHLVRTTRSAARLLSGLSTRITAHLHGACVGAGIELAAFCHRVLAAPDTQIRLPEVALGLVPGAGGTASLPRRMGRQRTCWLGLSSTDLDAGTALEWGLVDALIE